MAMVKDQTSYLIKLADRTTIADLGRIRPEKRRRIARETLEIYAAYRPSDSVSTI